MTPTQWSMGFLIGCVRNLHNWKKTVVLKRHLHNVPLWVFQVTDNAVMALVPKQVTAYNSVNNSTVSRTSASKYGKPPPFLQQYVCQRDISPTDVIQAKWEKLHVQSFNSKIDGINWGGIQVHQINMNLKCASTKYNIRLLKSVWSCSSGCSLLSVDGGWHASTRPCMTTLMDTEGRDTISEYLKGFPKHNTIPDRLFISCSGLFESKACPLILVCFFLPLPVRLLHVSLNQRNHLVTCWSKARPHWPQTLQTHQMWRHIISVGSSP